MKYTVQCLFAGYWSNEVIVEADTVEAACTAAMEEAGQDDGWRSLDDAGPTFITRVCEGEHDRIYSPDADKALRPVPYEHSERATGDIRDARELATILAALRYWQAYGQQDAGPVDDFNDIATDGGTLEPLSADDIDALCMRLNAGE